MSMITVYNLSHQYDGNPVVHNVSFAVEKGEIFGLLGPNGAGKSTIVNILITLLKNKAGTVLIDGLDLKEKQDLIRRRLGVIFQDPSLDERLTAYENLYFHARLYHVPRRRMKERIEEVLHRVDLCARRHDPVSKFSGGMKRRLEIARGILHEPAILFLDEPTRGLDPQNRRRIWDDINELRQRDKLTVFLTTHSMAEAETCDRIAIVDRGRMIASDTPAHLKKRVGGDLIVLRTDDNVGVRRVIQEGFQVEVLLEQDALKIAGADSAAFLPRLFDACSAKIIAVDVKKPTLEDVFIKLTGREIRDTEAGAGERLKNMVRTRRLK